MVTRILIILFALTLSASAQRICPPNQVNRNGLVGRWLVPGKQTGSVAQPTLCLDDSGKGNHGTTVSSPNYGTKVSRPAMTFNGSSQYVLFTDAAALKPSQITLSAWIYITQNPSGAYYIVERPKNTYSSYILEVDGNGKLNFNIGYTDSNPYIKTLVSSGALSLNTWHHVAGTYDLTNMFVYIDGVPTSTSFSSGILYNNSSSGATGPRIGVHDNGSGQSGTFFNGSINDVRIYNRALSALEIRAIYQGKQ